MSRPGSRDNSTAVSLFPFLAVLLCTMGALVILLVAMAQAASRRAAVAETDTAPPAQAAAEPVALPAPPDDESLERLRVAELREQQVTRLKDQAAESLRDDQTRLSHIEDHVRRLREQLVALKRAELELANLEKTHQDEQDLADSRLERLKELIVETEQEVERFEEEQRGKQKSFAIVPYKGPNGTRRRPLYIECFKDKVVLQPQGVVLEPIDFRPPLGVGNPLSAALRAARKYHRQKGDPGDYDPDSAPYPLVIVRPEGIKMYHRVRAALESGDADFGYEMVSADWNLDFGLGNPDLASRQHEAIEHSRLRRHLLARAAPSAYEGRGPSSVRVADARAGLGGRGQGTAGGGGASGARESGRGPAQLPPQARAYSVEDTLEYGNGAPPSQGGQTPRVPVGGFAPGGGVAGGGAAGRPNENRGDPYGAFAAGGADGETGNPASAGNPQAAASSQTASTASGGGASSPAGADGTANQSDDANNAGSSATAGQASGQQANQGGGSPGGSPNSQPAGQSGFAASFGQASGGAGGSGSGGPGGGQRRRSGLAIKRPISLTVYGDRVVITPLDTNGRRLATRASVLPLDGSTDQHLVELMTSVGGQIESWGIAGRGFYWKPVLVLSVAPDGGRRAGEIASLLGRRGVEVRYQDTANRQNTANNGGAGAQR